MSSNAVRRSQCDRCYFRGRTGRGWTIKPHKEGFSEEVRPQLGSTVGTSQEGKACQRVGSTKGQRRKGGGRGREKFGAAGSARTGATLVGSARARGI